MEMQFEINSREVEPVQFEIQVYECMGSDDKVACDIMNFIQKVLRDVRLEKLGNKLLKLLDLYSVIMEVCRGGCVFSLLRGNLKLCLSCENSNGPVWDVFTDLEAQLLRNQSATSSIKVKFKEEYLV